MTEKSAYELSLETHATQNQQTQAVSMLTLWDLCVIEVGDDLGPGTVAAMQATEEGQLQLFSKISEKVFEKANMPLFSFLHWLNEAGEDAPLN